MIELNNQALLKIEGGVSITGTFLNAISRGITVIMDLGRSFGSAIRRIRSNKICPI